jgi:hypothetical protein
MNISSPGFLVILHLYKAGGKPLRRKPPAYAGH